MIVRIVDPPKKKIRKGITTDQMMMIFQGREGERDIYAPKAKYPIVQPVSNS
jgi:hypothetical protein